MGGYLGPQPVPQAVIHKQRFPLASGQTSVATAGYIPGYVNVWLNGQRLDEYDDFTATNGSDVVLTVGGGADGLDVLIIEALVPFQVLNQYFTGTTKVDTLQVLSGITVPAGAAGAQAPQVQEVVKKSGDTMTGPLKVSSDGSTNSYQGQVRLLPELNAAGQWGGISLPDSSGGTSNSNQYWMIGRGNMISDRRMTIHMPSYADYGGSGYVPSFQICSTGDNKTLVADANGFVTTPRHPAFTAYRSNGPVGSGNNVVWNGTYLNRGGYYNTSTGYFTAPVSGVYVFNIVAIGETTSGCRVGFRINGTNYTDGRNGNGSTYASYEGLAANIVIQLQTNDNVVAYVQDGTMYGGNNQHSYMTGYLLG